MNPYYQERHLKHPHTNSLSEKFKTASFLTSPQHQSFHFIVSSRLFLNILFRYEKKAASSPLQIPRILNCRKVLCILILNIIFYLIFGNMSYLYMKRLNAPIPQVAPPILYDNWHFLFILNLVFSFSFAFVPGLCV